MTFGNAWGADGLSYNGKDMRQLAQSLGYGITYAVMGQGDMAVTAQLTPANTVRVAAGRALVNATGAGLTGHYHVWNDAQVTSPTFTATGADPRTDRVIVRVVAGVPTVQIVAGTPGPGTPAPPTVTGDNYMVLARVEIPASTSTITNAMIVDERIVVGQPPSRVVSAALPFLNPSAGDLNYEPDTGELRKYTGGLWQPVGPNIRSFARSPEPAEIGVANSAAYHHLTRLTVSVARSCVAAIIVRGGVHTSTSAGNYDWRVRVQVDDTNHPVDLEAAIIDGWTVGFGGGVRGYGAFSETIFWPLAAGNHDIDLEMLVSGVSPANMAVAGAKVKCYQLVT